MPFPGVNVTVNTGNLLRALPNLDAVAAICISAESENFQGVVTTVYSVKDAESKGITVIAEPFIHRFLVEYYTELAGNKKLFIMGFEDTKTMAEMLNVVDETGAFKMIKSANGEITHLGVMRNPVAGYDAGENFLDDDVALALTAGKALAQNFQAKNMPFRTLIEGRIANKDIANGLEPNTLNNGYCGVVLGSMHNDSSASVSLALARVTKYPAHVKIGDGQNGPLSAEKIYIGTTLIEERSDMEDLHDQGFITFHHRSGVAGYYFGVDNMATNDDARILVHANILDKAQRITAATYTPYVESNIKMVDDGTIDETSAKHLEDLVKAQLRANMAGQISNVDAIIDLNQNVIETGKVAIKVKLLPLGYLTWIEIELGLTTTI